MSLTGAGGLKRAKDGLITQRQAAENMGITERWVRSLLGPHGGCRRAGGGAVLRVGYRIAISGSGKPRRWQFLNSRGSRFGPTFASEPTEEATPARVSKETARKWMVGRCGESLPEGKKVHTGGARPLPTRSAPRPSRACPRQTYFFEAAGGCCVLLVALMVITCLARSLPFMNEVRV